MNLPNKLTIFRIILVPIMVIIPFLNIQGEVLGIPITYLIIDLIFIIAKCVIFILKLILLLTILILKCIL